jgi:hypothetical protein
MVMGLFRVDNVKGLSGLARCPPSGTYLMYRYRIIESMPAKLSPSMSAALRVVFSWHRADSHSVPQKPWLAPAAQAVGPTEDRRGLPEQN